MIGDAGKMTIVYVVQYHPHHHHLSRTSRTAPLLPSFLPPFSIPTYLHTQPQAWLQHIRLYPAVKDAAAFRSFILDQANVQPANLEPLWGGGGKAADGMAHGNGGWGGGGGGGGNDDEYDDMEMDDLFQGRHTEKDVAEDDDDVGLAHGTDDENFEVSSVRRPSSSSSTTYLPSFDDHHHHHHHHHHHLLLPRAYLPTLPTFFY